MNEFDFFTFQSRFRKVRIEKSRIVNLTRNEGISDESLRGWKRLSISDESLIEWKRLSKSRKKTPNTNIDKYVLPIELAHISDCLHKAEKILELKENWDDMGSEGFTQQTWDGVVQFLTTYAKQIYSMLKHCIDTPKIYPSATGSIDIDWETDTYGLLINIAKGGQRATYYADDKNSQITEGMFNPSLFNIHLLPVAIAKK